MKKMIAALPLFLAFASFGATTNIGIVNLEAPETSSDAFLAFATDGEIYEIDQEEKVLIELAQEAMSNHKMIEVELEEFSDAADLVGARNKIGKITLTSIESSHAKTSEFDNYKSITYDPAVLKNDYISDVGSFQSAQNIFRTMRQDTKSKSQCYNRAHAWSWEMYNRHSANGRRVQAGKIWLFFTRKFIREYKYKWWFHISPYVVSNGTDLIMDRKFTNMPVETRTWTDIFITPRTHCPEVYRYTDYSDNQYSSNCYVMKTSAHYWQPFNIEKAETEGTNKRGWNRGEIQSAYNDAVSGYGGWFNRETAPYL